MIEHRGGFEAVRERYLRLENPPFMRLVIEVSVAHYAEQNGDAMRAPEITFLMAPAEHGTTWTPLTFENSYLGCYQVVAQVTVAGLIEAKEARLMRDLRDFANQWGCNIKHQGFVEVFERQNGDSNGATTAGKVTEARMKSTLASIHPPEHINIGMAAFT